MYKYFCGKAAKNYGKEIKTMQKYMLGERQTELDEIKGVLIFMVVFGHMASIDPGEGTVTGFLHYLIYGMHMPIFVFISGYFSKCGGSLKKIFRDLIVPYVVFDILYVFARKLFGGGETEYTWNVLWPAQVMWYLLCLAVMRVIVSCVPSRTLPWVAVGCILLAFFSIQVSEHIWRFLTLGRAVLLFPIFYAGYCITPDLMRTLFRGKRIEAIIGIALLIAVEWLLLHFHVFDATAAHNYTDQPAVLLIKYAKMILSLIWFACFANLVSGRNEMLSRWGRNSLIIYLLHMYFVLICKHFVKLNDEWIQIIAICALSFTVTEVLSLDIFRTIYNGVFSRNAKLFKKGKV